MQFKKNFVIFIDFDAICSQKDLIINLGEIDDNINELYTDYEYGILSPNDFWQRFFSKATKDYLNKVMEKATEIKLDKYFIDFIHFCQQNNLKHIIISDSFDFIVDNVLNSNKLQNTPRFANTIQQENGTIKPIFSFSTEACFCNYGSCLRNIMLTNAGVDDVIAFIGNNYKAGCLAMHSDIIFANKSLAKFCVDNKIPHYPYKTFFDVKRTMEQIISKSKLKRRNQARILRKSAFEVE